MIKRIMKNKKIQILIISLLIVLLFYGTFIKVNFTRTTYRMYVNSYDVEFDHFLTIGRYITAIWWKIVSVLRL